MVEIVSSIWPTSNFQPLHHVENHTLLSPKDVIKPLSVQFLIGLFTSWCSSGHVKRLRPGAGLHHHLMLHFPQFQPQSVLQLLAHRDGLPHRRLRQVLPSEGPPHPTDGEEDVQLHLQL